MAIYGYFGGFGTRRICYKERHIDGYAACAGGLPHFIRETALFLMCGFYSSSSIVSEVGGPRIIRRLLPGS